VQNSSTRTRPLWSRRCTRLVVQGSPNRRAHSPPGGKHYHLPSNSRTSELAVNQTLRPGRCGILSRDLGCLSRSPIFLTTSGIPSGQRHTRRRLLPPTRWSTIRGSPNPNVRYVRCLWPRRISLGCGIERRSHHGTKHSLGKVTAITSCSALGSEGGDLRRKTMRFLVAKIVTVSRDQKPVDRWPARAYHPASSTAGAAPCCTKGRPTCSPTCRKRKRART
jgi:hypothetical protein